eukprot:6026309-Pyramimonas_sp.AAC.1
MFFTNLRLVAVGEHAAAHARVPTGRAPTGFTRAHLPVPRACTYRFEWAARRRLVRKGPLRDKRARSSSFEERTARTIPRERRRGQGSTRTYGVHKEPVGGLNSPVMRRLDK